jgi:polar amino acid transport system permease protein
LEYQFQFDDVFASWEDLLDGAWMTIQLSGTAMLIGLAVAVVCAMAKTSGPRPLRWLVNAYVEIIRNTPFLV